MKEGGGRVVLLATGSEIIGGGIRSLYSVIEEVIISADKEILITTYAVSGFLEDLFNLLIDAASRGVDIKIVVNRLEDQDPRSRKAVDRLIAATRGIEVYSFHDEGGRNLHMKVFVVDREKAVLGSANLTWRGLVDNFELGVYLEGGLAEKVSNVVRRIILMSDPYPTPSLE